MVVFEGDEEDGENNFPGVTRVGRLVVARGATRATMAHVYDVSVLLRRVVNEVVIGGVPVVVRVTPLLLAGVRPNVAQDGRTACARLLSRTSATFALVVLAGRCAVLLVVIGRVGRRVDGAVGDVHDDGVMSMK